MQTLTASARASGLTRHPAPAALAAWLDRADIRIDGNRPWDLQLHRPRLFGRVLRHWSLGLGEAYMDGDWDCEQLDEFFTRLLRLRADEPPGGLARLKLAWALMAAAWRNPQAPEKAHVVAQRHYDLGNDLFERMLDSRMVYSCGWWASARTLEQAQEDKLEMICRKLQLAPGMRLLDIGCGWGGLARHAALHHGAQVTGITVSSEQARYARRLCAKLPVRVELMDYRALQGRFERIASVGMFEHVGPKNHAVFLATAHRLLADDGLFLLHTIGTDRPTGRTDPWTERYIFPGGHLPAASELARAAERHFVIEDWHNFGADYDRTLMQWHTRFEAAWPELAPRYGERFRRMWRYYLLSCAGFFRSRQGQLWQLVLSKPLRQGQYRSIRPFTTPSQGKS
ncbi:MAG: cyclopropane fatty acyl phospholipid synthase [Betaproteobacteria bacterium]|jgi:cyclopropane-fatty-acyl-phospholipid synthase